MTTQQPTTIHTRIHSLRQAQELRAANPTWKSLFQDLSIVLFTSTCAGWTLGAITFHLF